MRRARARRSGWAGIAVRPAILLLLLLPVGLGAQQKGYRIAGNQILIDSRSHWEAWETAGGIIDVAPEGSVRPRFMRKKVNAAADAEKFTFAGEGGVVVVSNPGEARNLIDGDLSTTWGPDLDSPLKDWGITVNLGRIVVAQKIAVHFPEEDQGDPFLHFKVLVWRQGPSSTWRQPYTLQGTDTPNYWEIGRTIKPNKTERVLEFVPPSSTGFWSFAPLLATDRGKDAIFVGDPIESIQIIATDSDFDRAQEISREDYEALPDEKKGAVDYYRRGGSGREVLSSKEGYEEYDEDRKGSIKYYRKEIPRVAEVEVWTPGDNVNLGAAERGGRVMVGTNAGPKDQGNTVTDGDYSTGYNGTADGGKVYAFFEDLGALFWVDTQQYIVDGSFPMDALKVDISDGTLAPDGSIKWTRIGESLGVKVFREFRHEPARVRFVRALFENEPQRADYAIRHTQYVGFTEVMLYGQGFVPEVELTSDLIELDGSKNLISIEWEADTPPGTRVELQTRTGDTLLEEKVYYDSNGKVVTEARYNKLPKSKKGEITSFFKPSPDWDPWSAAYVVSGEEIKSPSPREFLLVKARLLSEDLDAAATLHSVRVNMSDPLADQLLGEVVPNRVQAIGQVEDFSFFIRPSFSSGQQGFDQILIQASSGTLMELAEVRLGTADEFANGQAPHFLRSQLEVIDTGVDTLWFKLPEPAGREVELIEVGFQSRIFANNVSFRASVQDSGSPGFWQRVDEGDATELVNSQVVTILTLEGNEVIRDLRVDSAVMTPNGDGINDVMVFRFDVVRIDGDKDVQLTICDLSGRVVHQIAERRPDPRGRYALVWAGDDRSGQLVPPGIYLARIEVAVDSDRATDTSMLRAVYVAY